MITFPEQIEEGITNVQIDQKIKKGEENSLRISN